MKRASLLAAACLLLACGSNSSTPTGTGGKPGSGGSGAGGATTSQPGRGGAGAGGASTTTAWGTGGMLTGGDYYNWTGSKPSGGSILMIGSSGGLTTGDQWMVRRYWKETKALRY